MACLIYGSLGEKLIRVAHIISIRWLSGYGRSNQNAQYGSVVVRSIVVVIHENCIITWRA